MVTGLDLHCVYIESGVDHDVVAQRNGAVLGAFSILKVHREYVIHL
jgi:hypothetical protein